MKKTLVVYLNLYYTDYSLYNSIISRMEKETEKAGFNLLLIQIFNKDGLSRIEVINEDGTICKVKE